LIQTLAPWITFIYGWAYAIKPSPTPINTLLHQRFIYAFFMSGKRMKCGFSRHTCSNSLARLCWMHQWTLLEMLQPFLIMLGTSLSSAGLCFPHKFMSIDSKGEILSLCKCWPTKKETQCWMIAAPRQLAECGYWTCTS